MVAQNQNPIASWDRARDVWTRMGEGDMLPIFEPSDVYSETFPTSGSMRNGLVYQHPTPDFPTAGFGSLSSHGPANELLRTPVADETGGGPLHPDVARERGQTLRLTGQILAMTGDLLPTPSASHTNDGEDTDNWLARRARVKAEKKNGNGMGMPLTIAAQLLDKGKHASANAEDE